MTVSDMRKIFFAWFLAVGSMVGFHAGAAPGSAPHMQVQ